MNWEELLAGTQAAVTGIVTLIVTAVAVLLGAFFIYSGISKMLAHSRQMYILPLPIHKEVLLLMHHLHN